MTKCVINLCLTHLKKENKIVDGKHPFLWDLIEDSENIDQANRFENHLLLLEQAMDACLSNAERFL